MRVFEREISLDLRFLIDELRMKYRSLSLSKRESALYSVFSMRVFEREISSSIREIPQIIRMIFRNDGTYREISAFAGRK
jgi:hypothetical protein